MTASYPSSPSVRTTLRASRSTRSTSARKTVTFRRAESIWRRGVAISAGESAALRPRGVFAGTRGPEPPCPRCDAPRRDVDAAHDVGRPVEGDGRERADREADLGGARPAPRVVPVDVDQKRGDLGRLSEAPVRWRRSRLSRGTSRGEPTRRQRLGHRVQAGAGGEILRRPRTAVEGDDRLAPPGSPR